MRKLSQVIHVAPTTMTSIVDRLVKRDYLRRRRAQQDRREVLIALSEKGKQFYEQHHHQALEMYVNFLSTLPDKGKKFYHSLNEVKKRISKVSEIIYVIIVMSEFNILQGIKSKIVIQTEVLKRDFPV
jgi:DNA-binding MarR family transcriptional regulator